MSVKNDVIQEVRILTRHYVLKGGKRSRLQHERRVVAFARFCRDEMKAPNLDAVGKRHVISYYKANVHLSDATRQSHYYALKTLFELARKGPPPVPFRKQCNGQHTATKSTVVAEEHLRAC